MVAMIRISQVPAHVLIDVLPLLSAPPVAEKVTGNDEHVALIKRFAAECFVPVEFRSGAKLTAVQTKLATWCRKNRQPLPSKCTAKTLPRLLRAAGFETYRSHLNSTALLGWRLR